MNVHYQAASIAGRPILRASSGDSTLSALLAAGVRLDELVVRRDRDRVADATRELLAKRDPQVVRYALMMPGGTESQIEDFQTIIRDGDELMINGFLMEAGENADSSSNVERLNAAMLSLTHVNWLAYEGFDDCARCITLIAAHALGVQRASVWMYEENRAAIRCIDLFEQSPSAHRAGDLLRAADYPRYFAAIESQRFVVANNAQTDPDTAEFRETYLIPNNIKSMLDAPLRNNGRTTGIMCIEQVGTDREWSTHEQQFVASLADVLSLAREQWLRRHAEQRQAELERRMVASQRMQSLGLLTSGIAHDFNNLLTPIIGQTSLLLRELQSDSPLRRHVNDIQSASLRAAERIRDLLAFAGKMPRAMEPLSVDQIANEARVLVDAMLNPHRGIEVKWQLGTSATIRADRRQLIQVLLNLVQNAIQAVGESGRITIASGEGPISRDALQLCLNADGLQPGIYGWLEVRDSGCGMDHPTLGRIFEPFFTTNKEHAGLGLAAVHGIVRSHDGAVSVDSTSGSGTRVKVLLPTSPNASNGIADLSGRRILIVDDVSQVAELMSQMARRFGMIPRVATDGKSALETFKQEGGVFDVAFIDLKMPELDGVDLMDILSRRSPELPIVLTSGSEPGDTGGNRRRYARFLRKPFSIDTFVEAVRAAINSG